MITRDWLAPHGCKAWKPESLVGESNPYPNDRFVEPHDDISNSGEGCVAQFPPDFEVYPLSSSIVTADAFAGVTEVENNGLT